MSSELQKLPNLAKAIISVMKSIKGIEKGATIGSGNYAYKGVSDQDVKNTVGSKMEEYGLCILPIQINPTLKIDRWNEGGKDKQSVFTEVNTKYLLLHESGESIEIAGYGHGVDAQDKGAGKATTYALKYALLYTFMIATGDIDDTDKDHSNDKQVPKDNDVDRLWKEALASCKTVEELSNLFNKNEATINADPKLKSLFTKRKAEVKK